MIVEQLSKGRGKCYTAFEKSKILSSGKISGFDRQYFHLSQTLDPPSKPVWHIAISLIVSDLGLTMFLKKSLFCLFVCLFVCSFLGGGHHDVRLYQARGQQNTKSVKDVIMSFPPLLIRYGSFTKKQINKNKMICTKHVHFRDRKTNMSKCCAS